MAAPAFQCHKTVDYSSDEPAPGGRPQQCAGLMSLLHKIGAPNQIMQVGQRTGVFDPRALDGRETYDTVAEAISEHAAPKDGGAGPQERAEGRRFRPR